MAVTLSKPAEGGRVEGTEPGLQTRFSCLPIKGSAVMKIVLLLVAMLYASPVAAFEDFVVETSEDDATDSLNRISGTIDKGFAPEGSTYHSVHHGRSGPFTTHEDAYGVSSTV